MNILCAALIRFPWKKRQTGFVITHAGLLIVLAGSYYSVRTADEGQVGMLEGDVQSELVRIDYPVIRVWEVDPHTQQSSREFDLPFRPARSRGGRARPRPAGLWRAAALARPARAGRVVATQPARRLSQPGDPFQFVVKEHLPASAPARAHVADPDGAPMARIRAPVQGARHAPGARCLPPPRTSQWFATRAEVLPGRPRADAGRPALVTFSSVDRPELVEDFLKPPTAAGTRGRRPVPLSPTSRARRGSSTGRSTGRRASRSRCPTAT